MIVNLMTSSGQVNVDHHDLPPIPPGEFLRAAISRRKLDTAEVAKLTGLKQDVLASLLDGSLRFDIKICRHIERAFPKSRHLLLKIQEMYEQRAADNSESRKTFEIQFT